MCGGADVDCTNVNYVGAVRRSETALSSHSYAREQQRDAGKPRRQGRGQAGRTADASSVPLTAAAASTVDSGLITTGIVGSAGATAASGTRTFRSVAAS